MAEKTHLQVEGMTCTNCALGVSRFLEKQGFTDVNVSFSTGDVSFESVEPVNLTSLKSGISALGYRLVTEEEAGNPDASAGGFTLERKLILCSIFTFPLLLHMVIPSGPLHNPWVQLVLTLPVFITGVLQFGRSAYASLKTGVPNMDVLIITGATAAFAYSIMGMFMHLGTSEMHNFLFFETSATIITLVLLGNVIEKRSVKQTTSAIRELAALQPAAALKISIGADMSEKTTTVKPSELKKGDPVLVNAGAVVPVDGTIYWGNASADESALTGESMPADKSVGDSLLAGSVILSGSVKLTTDKPGGQTLLSDIIQLVKQAQSSKPPIQKLGDQISAWFVPVVIGIALITFLAGHFMFGIDTKTAIMSAVAVLVISCPCAMGLATPTAVAVGLGKAARNGILIKGGDTLEQFREIKTVVFDKTGTLTTGEFRVTSLQTHNGYSEAEAINTIVSLEQHSDHPIARSVLSSLAPKAMGFVSFSQVEENKGIGISAIDDKGNRWMLGSHRIITQTETETGHTVYLTCNGTLVAWIDLTDEVRDGVGALVVRLKKMGMQVVMLSGDNEKRCREVAALTGIETLYSSQLPDQKTAVIRELKKQGKVIMIGDGINDAPSLTAADIGISFGQATRIAVNAAQVIIIDSKDISKIIYAIELGKKTLTTIRQNLFWAFAYNVVAIPIAAAGLLSPMIAALSMAFSDVVVIGNSLRLKIFRT